MEGVRACAGTEEGVVLSAVEEWVDDAFGKSIYSDCEEFRVLLAPAFSLSRGVKEAVSTMVLLIESWHGIAWMGTLGIARFVRTVECCK